MNNSGSPILGYEDKLWLAADKLRGSMGSREYKHVALGLIFLMFFYGNDISSRNVFFYFYILFLISYLLTLFVKLLILFKCF